MPMTGAQGYVGFGPTSINVEQLGGSDAFSSSAVTRYHLARRPSPALYPTAKTLGSLRHVYLQALASAMCSM